MYSDYYLCYLPMNVLNYNVSTVMAEGLKIWDGKKSCGVLNPGFSTPSFNPGLFNHELFNPGLFNHEFLNHGIEKSGIEKLGVEMSFNPLEMTFQPRTTYFHSMD